MVTLIMTAFLHGFMKVSRKCRPSKGGGGGATTQEGGGGGSWDDLPSKPICSLTSLASPRGHKGRSEGNSAEEALETPHDAITLPMNLDRSASEQLVSSSVW